MEEELLNEIVDWIVNDCSEDICQICVYYKDAKNEEFFKKYFEEDGNDYMTCIVFIICIKRN